MGHSVQVTVVIPSFNAGTMLREALRSVSAQDIPVETLVIDDGSTEPVDASDLKDALPQLTVIRQTNTGAGGARNNGIVRSSAPYIAFLDADDSWRPSFLTRQLAVLQQFPGAAGVLAKSRLSREAPSVAFASPLHFRELFLTLRGGRSASGWVFRRQPLLDAGLFDTEYRRMQDIELLLRMTGMGYTILKTEDPLYDYRPSAARGHRYGEVHLDSLERFAMQYAESPPSWVTDQLSSDDVALGAALMHLRACSMALVLNQPARAKRHAIEASAHDARLPLKRRAQRMTARRAPRLSGHLLHFARPWNR
jgi:glycosyltransferase involved in cell wall biosynthesis